MACVFSDLPGELRTLVWHQAAIEEASNRSVFVHQCITDSSGARASWRKDYRVKPTPDLKSAIMLVSHEARVRALEIYTFKMNILFNYPIGLHGGPMYNHNFNNELPDNSNPLPCHNHGRRSKGTLYLSLEHDVFVTGLARERATCDMVLNEIRNGFIGHLPPQRGLVNGVITFSNSITEPLTLTKRRAIKKVIMIRHDECTVALHRRIQIGTESSICKCGFGDDSDVCGYRVISTPRSTIFPSATNCRTYTLDITHDNAWLILALRLVWGSFSGPWV